MVKNIVKSNLPDQIHKLPKSPNHLMGQVQYPFVLLYVSGFRAHIMALFLSLRNLLQHLSY